MSENRTHDNHRNSFKFSYFLDSMWSPLFRFFSFVDRVSSHYFCRHPPSQQEVGKLQERKQFLKQKLTIANAPLIFPLVYRCSQMLRAIRSFQITKTYKVEKRTYIVHYNSHSPYFRLNFTVSRRGVIALIDLDHLFIITQICSKEGMKKERRDSRSSRSCLAS